MWSIVDLYRSLGKAFPALDWNSKAQNTPGDIFLTRTPQLLFGPVRVSCLGPVFLRVLERLETRLIA